MGTESINVDTEEKTEVKVKEFDKSKIMREIIEKNDCKLFKENKILFTEAEIKLIKDKLKRKCD